MAELVARKAHPGSGSYSSCGRNPAATLNPDMVRFMETHGFDLGGAGPAPMDLMPQDLVNKHVIISLQGPVRTYFPQLPFHTTALEWDVGAIPGEGERPERWEVLYRDIASRVRELMETLRGPNAP